MPVEALEDSHKYKLWKNRLLESGLEIHGIQEMYSRRVGQDGQVLFSLVLTDATTPEGHKIPPICFIKGEVVCVMICLIDEQTGEKHLLLVRQRRICDGSMTYEHPAGMLDSESDAAAVAAREVWEETGIEVAKEDLIQLLDKPSFPSTGTSDEAMYFFYCEIKMSPTKIQSFHNKSQGLISDHEYIETFVVPFVEGHRLITNTNGILLNFLYLKAVGDWELMQKL
ncbi:8-oxo-dGTP pyrophosphatase MutT (NUDIX family) [Dyadobacter jejuensis]|uniref:GDP-mannose pyrophosphatase n=1 Tax=Dyadobacter jejuensis TaxID=1082580 RepID=A0A316ANH5_9BACT|nr:NUDIX domain-containing protein [Dyadobacter jejuensis]PWJ59096.1 8-oxo-dGTP pyrophosphatase MutT (NUDIX family) [Dyadobacter jejuensis]